MNSAYVLWRAVVIKIALFSCLPLLGQSARNPCQPPLEGRTTVWGYDHVTVDLSEEPVRDLAGVVKSLAQPIDDVLVEVLEPGAKGLPLQSSVDAKSRRRIASCVTNKNGEFGFKLKAGRYEVIFSKTDWNSTSIVVVISPKGRQRQIVVPIKIGE